MEYVKDIILDDDFDLSFKGGDILVTESDEQHIQLITLFENGQARAYPLTGLGIYRRLQSPFGALQQDDLRREARLQLELDGYQPGSVSVEISDIIVIKADR